MSNRTLVAAVLVGAVLIVVVPLIPRAVEDFKTFLELSSLLNPCDGEGSPPPCHNIRR